MAPMKLMLIASACAVALSYTEVDTYDLTEPDFSALETFSQLQQPAARRRAGARGDTTVTGTLTCSGLASPTGNVTLLGDLCNKGACQAQSVVTSHLKSGALKVTNLITPRGALSIKGKIQVSGTVAGLMNSTCEGMSMAGMSQFATAFVETFEGEDAGAGWSHPKIGECAGNKFLGGHCHFGGHEVHKTFDNLPDHKQLRLSASFLMLDSWEGEHAYAKVDDSFIWLDNYDSTKGSKGINVCGGEAAEKKLNTPVDVVIPHSAASAKVTFGTTLDQHACDESWGVDNVQIALK